jgi:SAM-dependent methyltransferase
MYGCGPLSSSEPAFGLPRWKSDMDPNTQTIQAYELYADDWMDRRDPTIPEPFADAIKEFLSYLPPKATILEIGSGPGWTADFIEELGHRVLRTDATESFLAYMRARGHKPTKLNVLTNWIGGFAAFQGIWMGAVLHHFTTAQAEVIFKKLHTALEPNGVLGLTVHYGTEPYYNERWEDAHRYYQPYTPATIAKLLRKVDFTIASTNTFSDGLEPPEDFTFAIARK